MVQINEFYQIPIEDYHSPMCLMIPVSMPFSDIESVLLERGDEYLVSQIKNDTLDMDDYVVHRVDAPSVVLFKNRDQKITCGDIEYKEIHVLPQEEDMFYVVNISEYPQKLWYFKADGEGMSEEVEEAFLYNKVRASRIVCDEWGDVFSIAREDLHYIL